MKKNLVICAIMLFAAAFGASAQNLETATADIQKMVGIWTYSLEDPMDGGTVSGDVTAVSEDDAVYMTLGGFGESAVKTTALKPMENGRCQTFFYIEEYAFDVPLDLQLTDDDTIKVTVDVSGFYMEFDMKRKK